jgi:hypothetical protein
MHIHRIIYIKCLIKYCVISDDDTCYVILDVCYIPEKLHKYIYTSQKCFAITIPSEYPRSFLFYMRNYAISIMFPINR